MTQKRVSKKKQKDTPGRKNVQEKKAQIPWSLLSIILIGLVGIIAYSNSFDCAFHFDDSDNITENIAIRNLSNIRDWWSFVPSRPLGYLSFALNYHFHRLDVWGYHLVNVMIHIANAILVWWLVMLTLSTPVMESMPITRHKKSIALLTGLLFVSHPLATQSVTYIVQRLASLATFFYLLSLALYVKGRLRKGNKKTPGYVYYAGAVFCAVLGMLTKEIVFTLPFALLLYEFSFIKTDTWKFDIKDTGIKIFFIIFGIFATLFFLNFSFKIFNPVPILLVQGYDYSITAREYLLTQLSVILTYIRLFILPVNQNLDYDYPVSHNLFEAHTLLGLLSLAGIVIAGILLFRRYRLISFGIFWFFLTMSVESSIIPVSQNVIFEHRTYLPSLGFFLVMVSFVFYFLWDRNWQVTVGILLLLILTNSVLTHERNKVWKSDYTLWADCVKKSPNKPRPLNNYGIALAEAGNLSEALKFYNKAVELNPRYATAHNNLGNALRTQGNMKDAVAHFTEAIRINPNNEKAQNNLGNVLFMQGFIKEAVVHLREALRIKPEFAEAHYNLGTVLISQKEYDDSIYHLQQAVRIKPDYVTAQNNLGSVLLMQGKIEEAIIHFREALRIKPDYAMAQSNLRDALASQKKLR